MITYFLKLLGKYGDNFVFFTNKKILELSKHGRDIFILIRQYIIKIDKVVSSAKPGW